MPSPFNLLWSQSGSLIRGNGESSFLAGSLVFPVTFPGKITDPQVVMLRSPAHDNGTFDILSGMKFYLTGADADLSVVQSSWPVLGQSYTPNRPEMNGGLQISFDGVGWTTFSDTAGSRKDPSTWIGLPAIAVGLGGLDGTLGPFDTATLWLRYVIPASASNYGVFDINLAVDCDIV